MLKCIVNGSNCPINAVVHWKELLESLLGSACLASSCSIALEQ